MQRFVARLFCVAGALLLGVWLWAFADGGWAQSVLSRRLADLVRAHEPHAHGARRTRHEARTTGLVGRIEIRRLRLSAIILEGTSTAPLLRGVGHLRASPLPGERGNVVLAAHRDTWFRRLRNVRAGDRVLVTTPDGVFRYRVDTTLVVRPDRTDLIGETPSDELTLVTCYPFDWIGPAPDRFIVRSSPAHGQHLVTRRNRGSQRSAPIATNAPQ